MTRNRSVSSHPTTVVLTGGPGGGKTTLMEELRKEDPSGKRWILVPEAAPLLFRAGLDARQKSFQRAIVRLQMALETACAEAAAGGQVLLCHRGTLDPLAYWLRNGWEREEFFELTGMPQMIPTEKTYSPALNDADSRLRKAAVKDVVQSIG